MRAYLLYITLITFFSPILTSNQPRLLEEADIKHCIEYYPPDSTSKGCKKCEPRGHFHHSPPGKENYFECGDCKENCSICSDTTTCTDCRESFFINQHGNCAECSTKHCKECEKDKCSRCASNFYLKGDKCKSCGKGCQTCDNEGKCLFCKEGYVKKGSKCKSTKSGWGWALWTLLGLFGLLCLLMIVSVGYYIISLKSKFTGSPLGKKMMDSASSTNNSKNFAFF